MFYVSRISGDISDNSTIWTVLICLHWSSAEHEGGCSKSNVLGNIASATLYSIFIIGHKETQELQSSQGVHVSYAVSRKLEKPTRDDGQLRLLERSCITTLQGSIFWLIMVKVWRGNMVLISYQQRPYNYFRSPLAILEGISLQTLRRSLFYSTCKSAILSMLANAFMWLIVTSPLQQNQAL